MKPRLFLVLAAVVLALPGLALLSGCAAPAPDSSAEAKALLADPVAPPLQKIRPNAPLLAKFEEL